MTRPLLSVFGLKFNPFTPDIAPDALWRTPEIEHFCWRVEQQVRDGGFALITGESGTGKSITLRLLTRHLQTMPDVVAGVLSRPQSRMPDFYREMGEVFGVPMKVHYHWSSFKDLRSKWEAHLATTLWRPVLLIDEAQEMKPEVLSELRLLSSTQLDSRSILTVVVCGDNRLLDLLRLPSLIPLGTRVGPRLVDTLAHSGGEPAPHDSSTGRYLMRARGRKLPRPVPYVGGTARRRPAPRSRSTG
jgi:general secretion pathway protein A